jgi:hypothetical protein
MNSAKDEKAFFLETTAKLFKEIVDIYVKYILLPRYKSKKHKISKIKKALVSETGLGGEMMTSIQYMVKDKSIWMCPPITIE